MTKLELKQLTLLILGLLTAALFLLQIATTNAERNETRHLLLLRTEEPK